VRKADQVLAYCDSFSGFCHWIAGLAGDAVWFCGERFGRGCDNGVSGVNGPESRDPILGSVAASVLGGPGDTAACGVGGVDGGDGAGTACGAG